MAIPTYVGNPTESARGAQLIARKGVPVFPVNGKTPLVRWRDRATTNPVEVSRLWRSSPHAGIGIPTGPKSGFFVLDIDRQAAIAELPGAIPRTLTARTKNGGLHFYFKHAEGVRNSAGDIAEDVDVRGDGGFVVTPPSPGYTWVDKREIAEAPKWLLELIFKRQKKECKTRRNEGYVPVRAADELLDGEPVGEGCRNDFLARAAGRLHDGRDLADLERALLEVNVSRCSPALPEGEVLEIARSIYRYNPCTPGKGIAGETGEALARFEQAMLNHPWGRWKSGLSITKTLLVCAREFGRMLPNGGVAFNLSYAELSLRAAVSEEAIRRYTKRIKDTGLVRQDNAHRKVKEAGTWVLMPPAPTVGTPPTAIGRYTNGSCTHTSRTLPLTRPRLRYSERYIRRLGKSWEACRDVLEANGGVMTFEALAEVLGMSRARELRNPRRDGWLRRAERDGLVRRTSGGLALIEGWEREEDRVRERTGEIAAYTRNQELYKRRRLDWLDRLNGVTGEKRLPGKKEVQARRDLEVLREAGAVRARYRRKMKDFRAERMREKRREDRREDRRVLWAVRAMTNPDTGPGVITENYFFGELTEFDYIVGSIAQFYKDGENWRAWRWFVRAAFEELAHEGLTINREDRRAS